MEPTAKMDEAAASAGTSRNLSLAGSVLGAIPFFFHISSLQSFVEHTNPPSVTYRDWFGVACGVLAAVLGALALRAAPKAQPQRKSAMTSGFIALGLGLLQIARGFGAL